MKKENPDDAMKPENPPAPETPAKPRREKKEKKKEKKNIQSDDVHLPVLVELTYTVSIVLLIFVGLTVIIISVLTGASLISLVLRTSAALLAMGSLLVLIFHQVSSGVLQASLIEQEEAQKAQLAEAQTPENAADLQSHQMAEA